MDIVSLPKVELHLHLDCSLSYDVVSTINPAITRGQYEREFIAPAKCVNLPDYLTRARNGIDLMQTEKELTLSVEDLFRQLVADNVMYAEIRFAPLLHLEKGLKPEHVVEIVNEAADRATERTSIESRLILCTLRHFSAQQSMQTVKLVERFRGSRVAALDIAGDEAGFPLDEHVPAFQYAITNGIMRTAHAGEARGADSVWETLQKFKPTRVGHGVRSVEDSALLGHLKETRIHLELCPTSNIQTNVFVADADHPADTLYAAGVSVGINTDARTMSNVTLADEYAKLHRVHGWNEEHFRVCNLNAIEAAFVPEHLRAELASRIVDAYLQL